MHEKLCDLKNRTRLSHIISSAITGFLISVLIVSQRNNTIMSVGLYDVGHSI